MPDERNLSGDPVPVVCGDWSFPARFGFRFACLYWPLFFLVDFLPKQPVIWVGVHLFRLTGEAATAHPSGSGDTALDYVSVFCFLVLALAGAILWTVIGELRPRRREYRTLYAWLRLFVRFELCYVLLIYGFSKVFVLQFQPPGLSYLTVTYGESSPMRLLWAFMGASVPYTIFAGVAEVVPGVLLFFRRTSSLGALLSAGVMLNVVLLNFCYDVPVKLFSAHLLLASLFLLLPDVMSLWRIFLLGQSAAVTGLWLAPWKRRPLRVATHVLQALVIGALLYLTAWSSYQQRSQMPTGHAPAPLYGVWMPDKLEGTAPKDAWTRILFDRPEDMVVKHADGTSEHFAAKFDVAAQRIDFPNPKKACSLQWTKNPDGTLGLTGTWMDAPLTATLHKTNPDTFLLRTRGFHWVQEYPYNR